MTERVHCSVPFCKRTRRPNGSDEWVCGKHWALVPRQTRAAYNLAKRRSRRIIARKPLYREYWKLSPGSPARLSAVAMWRRVDSAWERCKREAIERAAGL